MKMVGLKKRFSYESMGEIPELWHQFGPKIDGIEGNVGNLAYGVVWDTSQDSSEFMYMVAVNQVPTLEVPDGMDILEIPEVTYEVFEHIGSLVNLSETIMGIFQSWLPQSGQTLVGFPSMLEVYGDEFAPETSSGRIELWVAVVG